MSSTKTESQMAYSYEIKKNISSNIRKYRKIRKLTQEKLAENADISYDFLRRIESSDGKCGLSIATLCKIAIALDVSLDDLVDMDADISINVNN